MSRRPVLGKTWGLVLLVSLTACSSADGVAQESASSGPTNERSGDSAGPTIAFLETDLKFVPGDARRITATVDPPGTYEVHFSLSGDFDDAFLDHDQVVTAADGAASATLTAPSSPRMFTVRATVGSKSAALKVSTGTTFADIEVNPRYTGARTVTTWTATVRTGSNCHALPGIPASDGPFIAEAPAGAAPVVAGVPVGVPLTVTLRAGHFAGGCADVSEAMPGPVHNSVEVKVMDRPLQMGGVSLRVDLAIDAAASTKSAWDRVATNLATNFVNGAASDATALLDSMLDKIPATPSSNRDAFRSARSTLGWDATLDKAIAARLGAEGLHGLLASFIRDAFPKLADKGISGTLTSYLGVGFASFEVSSFGGLNPSDIGPTPSGGLSYAIGVTWTSAPGDQVLFGGEPKWPLARTAAAMALEPARARIPDALTVPDALASAVSCADLGTLLTADSTTAVAYSDCAAACMQKLCEGALGLMWTRATYTPEDPTLVDLAATASATVGDDAKPSAFRGTWVGSLRVGATTDKIGGPATGTE